MTNLLKQDFKRAFINIYFLLAILICLLACSLGIYPYIDFFENGAIYFFLRAHSIGSSSVLALMVPLIPAIPFAFSYVNDKESGFINYIYLRNSKKEYIISRLISNSLAGGLSLALPLLFVFGLLSSIFPVKYVDMGSVKGAFSSIYNTSQVNYVFLLIGLAFIFGAVYSTLGLAVTAFVENKYLAIVFPFFVYFIPGILFPILGLDCFEPSTTFIPSANIYTKWYMIFIQQGILFILSASLFYIKVIREGDTNAQKFFSKVVCK